MSCAETRNLGSSAPARAASRSTSAIRSCSRTTAPTTTGRASTRSCWRTAVARSSPGSSSTPARPGPTSTRTSRAGAGSSRRRARAGFAGIPDPTASIGRRARPTRERPDRRHGPEPVGRGALDRGHVRAPQPSVPTSGRRHRRAPDRRRRRLSDRSDGRRARRRRLLPGYDDRFRRRDGRSERRDGSVGGRDRHRALSLRPGERVLRPAHGRSRLASVGAAREPARRLDRREAAEDLEPARGGRSGRASWRSAFRAFATEVERVSATALVGAGATAGPDLVADPNGAAWLVTQNASAEATGRFWTALLGPTTPGP